MVSPSFDRVPGSEVAPLASLSLSTYIYIYIYIYIHTYIQTYILTYIQEIHRNIETVLCRSITLTNFILIIKRSNYEVIRKNSHSYIGEIRALIFSRYRQR